MLEQIMNKKSGNARPDTNADLSRAGFIMDLVALATGVPAAQIRSPTRNHARAARARQIAMYLAYVIHQWTLVRVGAAFDRDRTTAAHACRLIEDLRDDDSFDREIERLEDCLRRAPDPVGRSQSAADLLNPNLKLAS